jgi:hypothetical protein
MTVNNGEEIQLITERKWQSKSKGNDSQNADEMTIKVENK